MMRRPPIRGLVVLTGLLALLAMGVGVSAERYERTDLHLISWEALPHWTPWWTGPIQGATAMAWLAENGFPVLLSDSNDDGVRDERDTIQLADQFGVESMGTLDREGTPDTWLVWGVGSYLDAREPNVFEMKVYDAGFPMEWEMDPPFGRSLYGLTGVEVELLGDPTVRDYNRELADGAAVIIGVGGYDPDPTFNFFYSGRSFDDDISSNGIYLTDLASIEDDPVIRGIQGSVLETESDMAEAWWLKVDDGWYPVEFMLAISPIEPQGRGVPDRGTPDEPCCPDLVPVLETWCSCSAYVKEGKGLKDCVVAIDYMIENRIPDCPVGGPFEYRIVVNHTDSTIREPAPVELLEPLDSQAVETLNQTGQWSPPDVIYLLYGELPLGATPPDRVELIVDTGDAIDECVEGGEENNDAVVPLGCPEADLPDLVVESSMRCECSPAGDNEPYCEITVVAEVTNRNPSVFVDYPFGVFMSPLAADGSPWGAEQYVTVQGALLDELNTTGRIVVPFTFSPGPRVVQQRCGYADLSVDHWSEVPESDETNNFDSTDACCEVLPDLTLEATASCDCSLSIDNEVYCGVSVDVLVLNVEPMWDVTTPFDVVMDPGGWGLAGPQTITVEGSDLTTLNSDGVLYLQFVFNPGGSAAPSPTCATLQLSVDPDDRVLEVSDLGAGAPNEGRIEVCCPVNETGDAPEPPPAGCPDITVEIDSVTCSWETIWEYEVYECTVEVLATLSNVGQADAGSFFVRLRGADGMDTTTVSGLTAGSQKQVTLGYDFEADQERDPGELRITADLMDGVDECDETNNTDSAPCGGG